jgi:ABC-2 type transport system ATP-binding protein
MKNNDIAIQIVNATKIIRGNKVLRNISLTINEGDICGLVGDNGSGKSMLLKAISGLIELNEGSIQVFNYRVGGGKMATSTGILIEHPGLAQNMSARENLDLLARTQTERQDIACYLSMLGVDPKDRRPVTKLSIGMQQKVAIAQALFFHPRLLLLDEPTSNLDETSGRILQQQLQKMNQEDNTTIIIASHQGDLLRKICNRVFLMNFGELRELVEETAK